MPSPKDLWEQGNCRDAEDADIFYPDRNASTYSVVAAKARQICRGDSSSVQCPIILECLFYGLVTEDRFGIWGGMSARERNALRRYGSLDGYRSIQFVSNHKYRVLIDSYLADNEGRTCGDDEEAPD